MQAGGVSGYGAIQAAVTQQSIDIAVLRKANDAAKAEGDAALKLIESTVDAAARANSAGDPNRLDVIA